MAFTDKYAGLETLAAREVDGSNNDGNGIAADDIGEAGDTYIRITPNSYTDGLNGMALPVQHSTPPFNPPSLVGDMPQAHAISNAVMAAGTANIPSSAGVNEWFDFFGQVLTHDVAEASTGSSGDIPPVLFIDGLPFPITRTPFETDAAGVRQQINEETSFLDLSFVYGNSEERLELARADLDGGGQSAKLLLGADGLLPTIAEVAADSGKTSLQVLQIFTEPGFGGLPDPATNPDPATYENRYYAGDNRVNQQPPLIALQTVWAREHNYQVDQLTPYATEHAWTQDQLFDAARVIAEAEWQNITFNEYVPKLIGTHADALYETYKSTHSAVDNAGIINEWTTVAFRFGHDQSSNDFTLRDASGAGILTTTLGNAFALAAAAADVPGAGHSAADLDSWIRGLTAQSAQEIDGLVVDGNRSVLFGLATADLEAFDIQRGRDHGVWNYNELRAGLGLATYATFAEFGAANGVEATRLDALSTVYGGDINKLDSLVGGLLETHYTDSQLGETFTLLNAIQFESLRAGDQFYFENRLADNPELLAEIKGTTFAEITDRNSGADHLHLDTFQVANRMEFTNGRDVKDGADDATYLKADLMIGGGGNDSLNGKAGADTLYGDDGNDRLDGGIGDDFVKAGTGNDKANGGSGDDHVWGDDGNDLIGLDGGNDWADGGVGNDCISCGGGDDIALGKEGNDQLSGDKGNDDLFGGDGKDSVSGDAGDDKCYGGAGNDSVSGGAGKDLIAGDAGNDLLSGGAGYDVFDFDSGSGKDKITDFSVRQDVIDLSDLEQFSSFADVQSATSSKWGKTIINLGDTDLDGNADTIELIGVSAKHLGEANFIYHEDTPIV
ncbi:MAG: peroxidase family protein [Hyphomicrobium sp.]|jgi:Ca2+-binding RTX toxin-like protein